MFRYFPRNSSPYVPIVHMKNRLHLSSLGVFVVAVEAVAAVVHVHRTTTLTSVPVCSVLIPSTAVATVLVCLKSPASDSVVLFHDKSASCHEQVYHKVRKYRKYVKIS